MLDDSEEQEQGGALEIDEDLPLVDRLERFCATGALVQRMVLVRELACCAEEVGVGESVGRLVPLVKVIANDPEIAVRTALAEQIPQMAAVMLTEPETRGSYLAAPPPDALGGPTAYESVLTELVPLLIGLLGGGPPELSGGIGSNIPLAEAASEALLAVAALVKQEDVGESVLRAVLCLAHDNELEENRVVATQLLGSLAPVLGDELCRQYVLPEFVCLADDPAFRVRKAAALRIGAVSSVVGPELTVQKLLPVFEVLARDEIWGVRKASVESISQVAQVLPLDVRTSSLEGLMHEFHSDSSRWVKISACQALGPFIATLPSEHISPALLSLFTQLANPANPTAADSDLAYSCAYNFPGVAQALGAARWGEIADSFSTLAGNIQWKVRRTLSCSLHDLAAVLGSSLTESELLPTFDLFIKDLDEVKVGVIQHLAAFIATLSPATRLNYLPVLAEVRAETDNWRFRHLLSSQLAAFGAAYPRAATQETLLPLALALCNDSVAEVRIAAISQVGKLTHLLVQPEEGEGADGLGDGVRGFVDTVCTMARAPSCYKRANCVQICASLIEGLPVDLVGDVLLPQLLPLATDRVANVRLALAELVKTRLICDGSPFAQLPVAMQLTDQLRQDVDRDVLRAAHPEGYEPPPYRCKPPPPMPPHMSWEGGEEDEIQLAVHSPGEELEPSDAFVEAFGAPATPRPGAAEAAEAAEAAMAGMDALRVNEVDEPDIGSRAGL